MIYDAKTAMHAVVGADADAASMSQYSHTDMFIAEFHQFCYTAFIFLLNAMKTFEARS